MKTLPLNPAPIHPRKKATEWQELVGQYERSGLTRKQFCDKHALVLSTFDYWRHKLRRMNEAAHDETVFIALSTETEAVTKNDLPWDVELQLGEGLFLRLRHPC